MKRNYALQTPYKVSYTVTYTPFMLDTTQQTPNVEVEISNIMNGAVTIVDQEGGIMDIIPVSTSRVYELKGGFYVVKSSNTIGTSFDANTHNHDDRYYLKSEAEAIANKGVANGYASLDSTGKVPSTQLPSYVDDVLEYANLASFPITGETGKIYIAIDTKKTYRWSGSTYSEISPTELHASTHAVGGSDSLNSLNLNFNKWSAPTTAGTLANTGDMVWDANRDCYVFRTHYGEDSYIGETLVMRGKNTSGGTLTKGTIVQLAGSVGASGMMEFTKYDGTKACLGVLPTDVLQNEIADIYTQGTIKGINTTTYTGILYAQNDGTLGLTVTDWIVAVPLNQTNNGTIQVRVRQNASNDLNTVHKTGDETIDGNKTFNGELQGFASIGAYGENTGIYNDVVESSRMGLLKRLGVNPALWVGKDNSFEFWRNKDYSNLKGNEGTGATEPVASFNSVSGEQVYYYNGLDKTKIGSSGLAGRAWHLGAVARHATDGTGFRVEQYVDRDTAIVNFDTWQLWMYPTDTNGAVLDLAQVFAIDYSRVDGTTVAYMPRDREWDSFTPVASGSTGGSGTIQFTDCRYKRWGKICIYEGQAKVVDKGTLSGDVQISLPITAKIRSREFSVADSSFVGTVGQVFNTCTKFIGIQSNIDNQNLRLSPSFAGGWVQWNSMSTNEFLRWRIIYESN